MDIFSNDVLKVNEFNVEILGVRDDVFNSLSDCDCVLKGYIFHFYLGDSSIMNWKDDNYKFSLQYNWKLSIPGSTPMLEQNLENFKNKLIANIDKFSEDLDQFGYLFVLIKQGDYINELVISSESFGFDKVVSIIAQKETADE